MLGFGLNVQSYLICSFSFVTYINFHAKRLCLAKDNVTVAFLDSYIQSKVGITSIISSTLLLEGYLQ